jgi:CSLREA domain-containing protein
MRSAPRAAGPIIVNTLTDESAPGDGKCSLREAITNANSLADTTGGDCAAGTGTDSINFSVSGTITLVGGLPPSANKGIGCLGRSKNPGTRKFWTGLRRNRFGDSGKQSSRVLLTNRSGSARNLSVRSIFGKDRTVGRGRVRLYEGEESRHCWMRGRLLPEVERMPDRSRRSRDSRFCAAAL